MQVQAEISVFSPTRHRQLSTGTLAPEIENRALGAQADAPPYKTWLPNRTPLSWHQRLFPEPRSGASGAYC